ncbi:DUF2079 domain-containing protein [Ruminococcus sp. XPD3002]|uniref:DUF2079 domain-containing protein n=1 Tax=Ruminococcus sp. XPD3002 TaxID=1452269 RepID=UPI000921DC2A|nr:Uncharacterized membrane protein [Ruminococcus flavefaciens]
MSKRHKSSKPASEKAVNTAAEKAESAAKEIVADAAEIAAEEAVSADKAEETVKAEPETAEAAAVPEKKTEEDEGPGLAELWTAIRKKAGSFGKRAGIPDMMLVHFITAFFSMSAVNLHVLKKRSIYPIVNWKEFVDNVSLPKTMLFVGLIFVLLTAIYYFVPKNLKKLAPALSIGGVMFFGIEYMWRLNHSIFSMGNAIICLIFIYYLLGKLRRKKIFGKIPTWLSFVIVTAAATAVCAFVAVTTVCRHKNFGSSSFDFGIFVQMYHSLGKNLTAVTTLERDKFLTHFKVHSSYIFYLLVPIYKLFPSETTLLVSQAVLAMGGFIPMFLICRRHNLKGASLIFMSFAYVFCCGLIGPNYYEFHENAFLPTLLMWLLWAVDAKKYIPLYIFSVLVCIVKEDAPLYVICIVMYMFFREKGEKKRFNCLIIAVLSGIYMVTITNWLMKHGDGNMMTSSRFGHLLIHQDAGLGEVVKNVLADPAYFFSTLLHDTTLQFFMECMLPLLFMPFFTKKVNRFLLMLPWVIMNMVIGANYGYASNIGFQYIYGPICPLIYMSIINLDDMGRKKQQDVPVLLGCAGILMSLGLFSHNIGTYESHKREKDYFDALEEMLDRIPEEASVGGDNFLLPHMADRDEAYIFDFNDLNQEEMTIIDVDRYDYFVIPTSSDLYNAIFPYFEKYGITEVDDCQGRIKVFKNPNSLY